MISPPGVVLTLFCLAAVVVAQTTTFTTVNSGLAGFTFNGGAVNPTLFLVKGTTYTFIVSSVSSCRRRIFWAPFPG